MTKSKQQSFDNYRLATCLCRGDRAAFEEIFHVYCLPLKAFAQRELKSEALAEDAVQEVFCKLWLNRKKLDANLSLSGFLFTSLKNHILNVVRTRHREIAKNYRFAYDQQRSSNRTEQEVIGHEIEKEVHQLIGDLPELKRNILQLSIYRGLSNKQIAEKLNVSSNTVKIYLSQSSRQLRQLISLHGGKFIIFLLNTLS